MCFVLALRRQNRKSGSKTYFPTSRFRTQPVPCIPRDTPPCHLRSPQYCSTGSQRTCQRTRWTTSAVLRTDLPADTADNISCLVERCGDFKCSYKDTKSLCQETGLSFIPMIVEAVGGGWGKSARCVWSSLAKTTALATGELETEGTCAVMLQQRLSMTLHRENARACLRRLGP